MSNMDTIWTKDSNDADVEDFFESLRKRQSKNPKDEGDSKQQSSSVVDSTPSVMILDTHHDPCDDIPDLIENISPTSVDGSVSTTMSEENRASKGSRTFTEKRSVVRAMHDNCTTKVLFNMFLTILLTSGIVDWFPCQFEDMKPTSRTLLSSSRPQSRSDFNALHPNIFLESSFDEHEGGNKATLSKGLSQHHDSQELRGQKQLSKNNIKQKEQNGIGKASEYEAWNIQQENHGTEKNLLESKQKGEESQIENGVELNISDDKVEHDVAQKDELDAEGEIESIADIIAPLFFKITENLGSDRISKKYSIWSHLLLQPIRVKLQWMLDATRKQLQSKMDEFSRVVIEQLTSAAKGAVSQLVDEVQRIARRLSQVTSELAVTHAKIRGTSHSIRVKLQGIRDATRKQLQSKMDEISRVVIEQLTPAAKGAVSQLVDKAQRVARRLSQVTSELALTHVEIRGTSHSMLGARESLKYLATNVNQITKELASTNAKIQAKSHTMAGARQSMKHVQATVWRRASRIMSRRLDASSILRADI